PERANQPFELSADKTVTLDASVVAESGPAGVILREYLQDTGGLPKPNPWPRSFQSELDVCRNGLLKTVWDDKSQRWSHCIGWAGSHSPGFAALLWLDSQVAEQPAGPGGRLGPGNVRQSRGHLAALRADHRRRAGVRRG